MVPRFHVFIDIHALRYLTKLCDQVVSLISDEHANALEWGDESEDIASELDDEMDRMFAFQVSKTNEQEENVIVRQGFEVCSHRPNINMDPDNRNQVNHPRLQTQNIDDHAIDPSMVAPRLVPGETASGFMTAIYQAPRMQPKSMDESITSTYLRDVMFVNSHFSQYCMEESKDSFVFSVNGAVQLGPTLSEDALRILLNHGLGEKVSAAADEFHHKRSSFETDSTARIDRKKAEVEQQVRGHHDQIVYMLQKAMADIVILTFK